MDIWAPSVGPLSLVGWPKYELMLGWKGRLKERFVVDMVSILCRDSTLWQMMKGDRGWLRNERGGWEKRALPPLACQWW